MEGRSRHCPHLGLKHTRSIRFSSPTPEHRCYIFGDPLPIQVDQREYCLGDRYPECPRFAGQEAPPAPAAARPARTGKPSGIATWWQGLGKRDRILYLSLVGLLLAILATYGIIIGVVLPARGHGATATAVPTSLPPAPTTVEATLMPVVPTTAALATVPTVRLVTPVPTTAAIPPTTAAVPPTPRPTTVPPTTAAVPPTPRPTTVPSTTAPTATPGGPTIAPTPESMWSLLYFLGPAKGYYVPVERESRPYTEGVAQRALELMIDGPLPGSSLLRSMPAGMGLNETYREGGTLYVDLDHTFESLGAGQKEALAVVLAMTEFSTVERVQFLVGGQPYGLPGSGNTDPVERPDYVNFEDPYDIDPANASNLILYFATPDGRYLFPMVRRVPYTEGVARATINEMIKGPASGYQAITVMPAGTLIQNIYREEGTNTIVVDFNSAFLSASNHALTVQALILAMTDLTADKDYGVDSVRISVNGADLGTYWGSAYSGNLYRQRVNPESP